jgi:hypothetical protein
MLFEQVMPLKYFPIPNMHNKNKMDVYQKHSAPRNFSFFKNNSISTNMVAENVKGLAGGIVLTYRKM